MTDEQYPVESAQLEQITVRLNPDRAAKLAAHVELLRSRLPAAAKVTTTMAILDLFDRGVGDVERVSRDKARAR